MVKSPSKKKKLFPTPHLNSLSGIPIHMPLFPSQLWLTASIIIIIIIIIIILKQTEQWYLLLCWKCYDEKVWCRSRFQSQIHPLRECKRLDKKKVLIKLNTSFLLIFNLLLLGLWLSYWMWFQSWWKNNLFWLSRWENFFLWSQHSSCDEDNRGSLCSMHRCCLPPHPTQLGGNLWVGWAG